MHDLEGVDRGVNPQKTSVSALALQLEELLVSSDRRGMAQVRQLWTPGYLHTAAELFVRHCQRVVIVSGFPVGETYETDGPAGAIALLQGVKDCGGQARLVGFTPYIDRLRNCVAGLPQLNQRDLLALDRSGDVCEQLQGYMAGFAPTLLIFVAVPGQAADGCYYNPRFEDISDRTLPWEKLLELADCYSIAIADSGNHLGMGRVADPLARLSIVPAVSWTDGLVIADIANWGACGLLALASAFVRKNLLRNLHLTPLLEVLSRSGIVDSVTGMATASEDGLPAFSGEAVVTTLRNAAQTLQSGF
ncbi:glutamate cyclase domain-containing protein [Microbulbifer sp. TYP-18]|uniref:glutamate cyclase domain-containing protein n=1 Tax=Microbulbifer sp. TYP-18 TaxID=3230024 RepID=UPI0034C6B9D8